MTAIREATAADLPEILAISNWAAEHTPANFAIEPESLGSWQQAWIHDAKASYSARRVRLWIILAPRSKSFSPI